MLGTWMQQMAQGWVVAGLTTSAFTLGVINFTSGIPMLLLTMYGGVLADRHDKRLIVIAAVVVQMALAIGVGILISKDAIAVWHIVLAGACLGLTTAFEVPAVSALVPELVEKEQIGAAIAIDRSVFHATRLAGPALGGWLIGMFGTAAAFFANALSYPALIIALLTIRPRVRNTSEKNDPRRIGMREGIVYVRSDAPSIRMIGLLALLTISISPFFIVLMPLYSRHVLGVGPAQHGILMGASGIGAVIGSVRLLQLAGDRRGVYLRGAAACICVALLFLAMAPNLVVAVAAMIFLTIGTSLLFGLANTIVQERAPDEVRGRVSAIVGLSFFGVLPFSGLLTAEIADVFGLRMAMLLGAIVFALGAIFLLRTRI